MKLIDLPNVMLEAEDAHKLVLELCREIGVPAPRLRWRRTDRGPWNSKRCGGGYYTVATRTIIVLPHRSWGYRACRLHFLIHELAHHVDQVLMGGRTIHGKPFEAMERLLAVVCRYLLQKPEAGGKA